MNQKKGCFITFEGIDGSGKSTQIQLLKSHMEAMGSACCQTLEPSGGPVGSLLRQYLSGRMKADEYTLAALFAADRLDHLHNTTDGICSKINQGIHVICDRYVLSNYAYQGVKVPIAWIMQLNQAALDSLRPDCHIFIDVSPEAAMERMAKERFHSDLYETEERLKEVRDCYHKLIKQLERQEKIFVIDGNQPIQAVFDDIWEKVAAML